MTSVRLISITAPCIPECKTAEELIVYTARVSNKQNQANMETAPKLLKYLYKKKHWSPFDMVNMTLEIITTRDIAHQILRHWTFKFQEFSQRYAEATEFEFSEARLQDNKNRQNSLEVEDETLQGWWLTCQKDISNLSYSIYKAALSKGIAKEVARKVLPEGLTQTTIYMSGTVRSWIHYCQLRTDPGTQKEHRTVAEECKRILLENFPSLSDIFEEK